MHLSSAHTSDMSEVIIGGWRCLRWGSKGPCHGQGLFWSIQFIIHNFLSITVTRLLFTHSYLSQNSMTSVCYCYKIPWLFQGADTLSFSRMVWISVGHKLEMHPKLVTSLQGCPWCKLIRLQNTASCFQRKFSSLNQTQCWTQFLFKAITKWNHVSMKIVSHSIKLLIKQDLLITGVYPAMWD